jgi:hypothetical protein
MITDNLFLHFGDDYGSMRGLLTIKFILTVIIIVYHKCFKSDAFKGSKKPWFDFLFLSIFLISRVEPVRLCSKTFLNNYYNYFCLLTNVRVLINL